MNMCLYNQISQMPESLQSSPRLMMNPNTASKVGPRTHHPPFTLPVPPQPPTQPPPHHFIPDRQSPSKTNLRILTSLDFVFVFAICNLEASYLCANKCIKVFESNVFSEKLNKPLESHLCR